MTSININNKNISLLIRSGDIHLGCFGETATKILNFQGNIGICNIFPKPDLPKQNHSLKFHTI